ncbi:ATP-binding protein [Larkinella bovis]|uniref:histidine kinase n=1 Tax=Larkinella bovis TaxID=683041 RepID=A0ABW0I8X3_9BACT
MSLHNRLTLLSTAIVSVLLAIFCLFLYLIAQQYRKHEFLNRLRAEALTAGHLLVGQDRIGPDLYKLIDKNQLTVLPDEEIIIYDAKNRLIYESGTDYLTVTPSILARVRELETTHWREGDREIVGIRFAEQTAPYLIFASAIDSRGVRTIQDLAKLLGGGWFLMTGIMLVAGRYFMGRILQPISRINQRIDEITASNLSLRLPEGKSGDELTQLAQRFNRMLNRLEEAFRLQRSFVSHASHELRTPLTAITGQLQVSLLADDEPEELRATLRSVLDDVRGLNRMANGLLALANASMDSSAVPMGPVQIKALVEQVRHEVQRLQPGCTVELRVESQNESDDDWQLTGSEPLLRTAFFNLMDNGCKFSSNHTVTVSLSATGKSFQLTVHNTGSVIPSDQLTAIFIPFQRGRNASGLPGFGIGLPLTERIVKLHQGQIEVHSSAEAGTTFVITLPR